MRRHSHNLKLHSTISPPGGSTSGAGGGGGGTGTGTGGGGSGSNGATTIAMTLGNRERIERIRNRSDSETLSDEPILESNDEGIGTDHIDEKIEDGEIRSAKELELYMGMGSSELIESGKSLLAATELSTQSSSSLSGSTVPGISSATSVIAAPTAPTPAVTVSAASPATSVAPETVTMAQLQLPSIVIQSENGDRALSPVSSRSESPIR